MQYKGAQPCCGKHWKCSPEGRCVKEKCSKTNYPYAVKGAYCCGNSKSTEIINAYTNTSTWLCLDLECDCEAS